MSEKRYYWLKLPDGFFGQKEIKKLRKLAGGDTFTIIYLKMLLLSLKDEGRIYFDGYYDSFEEELADTIDEDCENVNVVVRYLISKGLMECVADDEYVLTKCAEMIGSESSIARRVRKSRIKKSESEAKALHCNTDVTNCNTEIEIEKEIEKDIELETESEKERETELYKSTKVDCSTSVKRIIEEWNRLDSLGVPKVSTIHAGTERYRNLIARLKQNGEEKVLEAIEKVYNSDFLIGKKTDFMIKFDWFVKPNNFQKVLDGNYDNKAETTGSYNPFANMPGLEAWLNDEEE